MNALIVLVANKSQQGSRAHDRPQCSLLVFRCVYDVCGWVTFAVHRQKMEPVV